MPNYQMTKRIHQAWIITLSLSPGAFPVVNSRMCYFEIHDGPEFLNMNNLNPSDQAIFQSDLYAMWMERRFC